MFSLIVATDKNFGIAKDSKIPWYFPEDLKLFKKLTTETYKKNVVVMGWKTWKSLPNGPLKNRKNIIITKEHFDEQVECPDTRTFISPEAFLLNGLEKDYHYWIIGGQSIYDWFINMGLVHDIYHTLIDENFSCDRVIHMEKLIQDNVQEKITILKTEHFDTFHYKIINREEQQILDILRDIIDNGDCRMERTGTGTMSSFGYRAMFNLENNTLPLMTTRNHSLRWIFEELMWILRGQTDVKILETQGINIWSPNSSKEFIQKLSLEIPLEEGDIGASYGFQMRHFGDNYENCKKVYSGGIDQLREVIHLILNNPTSRRIIISLWNPLDIKRATLPPCLLWYQFYVRKGFLDCQFMNRSSDTSVAGGWNVTTASLLTILLAKVTGLNPGKLLWIIGDAHVYMNNIESTERVLDRTPRPYPKLFIRTEPKKLGDLEYMLNLKYEDLLLINYKPEKPNIHFFMNI